MALNFQNDVGLFVPTTNIWDVEQLKNVDVTKPEFKELLIRLYQTINNITLALNLKDSAYYLQQEFVTGQAFFLNPNVINPPNKQIRQAYRMVIDCGPLPVSTTVSIPHNILVTHSFTFTRIYGAASNLVAMTYLPLPYVSISSIADNIQLSVDSTYIYITTGTDLSAYTTTYVVLEYLKE